MRSSYSLLSQICMSMWSGTRQGLARGRHMMSSSRGLQRETDKHDGGHDQSVVSDVWLPLRSAR